MQIRRLGYALGAEITGVDLRSVDARTIAEIRRAWLEHLVLCFPEQQLTKAELIAFAAGFGEPEGHDTFNRDREDTRVLLLTNRPVPGSPGGNFRVGEQWHSDTSHRVQPNLGTFLYARHLPPAGGDTMFSNQYRAYETLSPVLQQIVDGLEAVHDHEKISKLPPVVHPAVKIHPETGRKALYVSERVRQFVGMTEEESRPLVDFLVAHAVAYERTYRHRWRADDVIMWDNRSVMHLAVGDYDVRSDTRIMWRCSLLAEKSGRLYDPAEVAVAAGGLPEFPDLRLE